MRVGNRTKTALTRTRFLCKRQNKGFELSRSLPGELLLFARSTAGSVADGNWFRWGYPQGRAGSVPRHWSSETEVAHRRHEEGMGFVLDT